MKVCQAFESYHFQLLFSLLKKEFDKLYISLRSIHLHTLKRQYSESFFTFKMNVFSNDETRVETVIVITGPVEI